MTSNVFDCVTGDTWQGTCVTWHLKPDTWHLTPYTWQVTPDTWFFLLFLFLQFFLDFFVSGATNQTGQEIQCQGTCVTWHLKPDTWHLTPYTWQVTPDTWSFLFLLFLQFFFSFFFLSGATNQTGREIQCLPNAWLLLLSLK